MTHAKLPKTKLPAFIEQELLSMISSFGVAFEESIETRFNELRAGPENFNLSLLICELAEFGNYPHEEQGQFFSSLDSLIEQ